MTNIEIIPGDNRASLRRLIDAGVRAHSVVTDPPYGLTSIVNRFAKSSADDGTKTSERINARSDGFARIAAGGFMGRKWDGSGIERDPEFWRLVYEIMLPGAYCVAFSSSRTGHWQACAMEMAGFVMHPMLGWVFGQGFPKAHNAAKAIDRELGANGTYDGVKPGHEGFKGRGMSSVQSLKGTMGGEGGFARPWMENEDAVDRYHSAYTPGSPEARQWDGWAYGGQALKPALEPIYVGQKPFSEKNGALNLLKHGVGAINIRACRVATDDSTRRLNKAEMSYHGGNLAESYQTGSDAGRHPANLLHDGSDAVIALFPQTTSGVKNGGQYERETGVHDGGQRKDGTSCFGDTGSAARFFNAFPPDADPIFYQPKATKADRAGSKHPTVKPIALMRWLCRLVTPPGGMVLDPFGGSGTTAEAARLEGFDCTLMEAEPDYVRDLYRRFPVEGGIFG